MRAYRLVIFAAQGAGDVSFEFEAQTDCDAVRTGAAAAAGEGGALWRDGDLLLKLERLGVDQPAWAHPAGAD